jgi:hypothetical protein
MAQVFKMIPKINNFMEITKKRKRIKRPYEKVILRQSNNDHANDKIQKSQQHD